MIKIKITLAVTLIILLGLFSLPVWHLNLPLVSPLDLIENLTPFPLTTKSNKVVFGYFPYWNVKYSNQITIKHLTHLAYFGLDLNSDGTIKKLDRPHEQNPGWNKFNSSNFNTLHRQLNLTNKKTILVVKALSRDQIESLINNPSSQQTALNTILKIVKTKHLNGINIDFESSDIYDQATRNNFTHFIKQLSQECKNQLSSCSVSIAIYADSAIKNRLYHLPKLVPHTDLFIVMAYDFYRPSSNQAGPVAPLRGKGSLLDYDVTSSIADISQQVPPHKILLGIPFYGYQWQTASNNFLANSYPKTGSLATYKRVISLLNDNNVSSLSASWSAQTLSPYLTFKENNKLYQIHYEDVYSLSLKLDLVNQANLAGIAIWALGYEIPHQDIWQTISSKL